MTTFFFNSFNSLVSTRLFSISFQFVSISCCFSLISFTMLCIRSIVSNVSWGVNVWSMWSIDNFLVRFSYSMFWTSSLPKVDWLDRSSYNLIISGFTCFSCVVYEHFCGFLHIVTGINGLFDLASSKCFTSYHMLTEFVQFIYCYFGVFVKFFYFLSTQRLCYLDESFCKISNVFVSLEWSNLVLWFSLLNSDDFGTVWVYLKTHRRKT